MFKDIRTQKDVREFMQKVCYFHDSCIKEMK